MNPSPEGNPPALSPRDAVLEDLRLAMRLAQGCSAEHHTCPECATDHADVPKVINRVIAEIEYGKGASWQ